MGYVCLEELYDAVAKALYPSDEIDLARHIMSNVGPSTLREFIDDTLINEYLADNVGALGDYINDSEVEAYIMSQGSTCLDNLLDDDIIVDYCDGHGYKVLTDAEEEEEFVKAWCEEHGYRILTEEEVGG